MNDTDLLPTPDDRAVREHLEHCLSGVDAPGSLTGSAIVGGRRLRARRRRVRYAGGLAAAAACGALVVSELGGGGSTGAGFADDPAPSGSAVPRPPAGEGSEPQTRPAGWWDMPSRRMLGVLKERLPEGVRVVDAQLYEEGTPEHQLAAGAISGVLSGPTGPGAFQVVLYAPTDGSPPEPATTTTDEDGNQVTTVSASGTPLSDRIACEAFMTTCEPVLDVTGATIGRVSSAGEGGTTYEDVMLLAPSGGGLYLYVADSSGEKPGYEPPSAGEPPLTADQLLALAQDPAWTSYVPAD